MVPPYFVLTVRGTSAPVVDPATTTGTHNSATLWLLLRSSPPVRNISFRLTRQGETKICG